MTKGKDVRIYKSYKKIVRRYNRDSGYIEFYEEEDRWDFPFIRRKMDMLNSKKIMLLVKNLELKVFLMKMLANMTLIMMTVPELMLKLRAGKETLKESINGRNCNGNIK